MSIDLEILRLFQQCFCQSFVVRILSQISSGEQSEQELGLGVYIQTVAIFN